MESTTLLITVTKPIYRMDLTVKLLSCNNINFVLCMVYRNIKGLTPSFHITLCTLHCFEQISIFFRTFLSYLYFVVSIR